MSLLLSIEQIREGDDIGLERGEPGPRFPEAIAMPYPPHEEPSKQAHSGHGGSTDR